MEKKKSLLKNIPLRKKVCLLVGLVIIYIAIVLGQWFFFLKPSKERLEHNAKETQQPQSFLQTENIFSESESVKLLPESEETQNETQLPAAVTIKNLDTLAAPVMGKDAPMLADKLEEYNQGKGIQRTQATLLEVGVSVTEDKATEFYIENDDGTLVTLVWNPYRQTVEAKACQYTLQEITDNVWMRSAGEPMEHGISKAQDDSFTKEKAEEKKETEGSIDDGNTAKQSRQGTQEASDGE